MTAKQTTLTREISAVVYTCDRCSEEIEYDFFHPYPCCVCGRHFHAVKCDPKRHVSNGSGDHPDIYCGECWAIGEPFHMRAEAYELAAEREREDWYKLAKEAAKGGHAEIPPNS